MAIYVYATSNENKTLELAEALDAKRLRKFDGLNFLHKGKAIVFDPNDIIICWGSYVPPITGLHIYNGTTLGCTDLTVNNTLVIKQNTSPQSTVYGHIPYRYAVDAKITNGAVIDPTYGPMLLSIFDGYGYPEVSATKERVRLVFANKELISHTTIVADKGYSKDNLISMLGKSGIPYLDYCEFTLTNPCSFTKGYRTYFMDYCLTPKLDTTTKFEAHVNHIKNWIATVSRV